MDRGDGPESETTADGGTTADVETHGDGETDPDADGVALFVDGPNVLR